MRCTVALSAVLALLLVAPVGSQEPKKAPPRKPEPRTHPVPYRLSNTKHILVRAKLNGKGPFNFIVDTGAPVLFVSPKICRKLDVEPDKNSWAVLDRFELEGGLVIPKAKGRVEEPPQLQGMNSLGLAGAELHGVIGYNLIARYRVEIDFTRDKMLWTEQPDFAPPTPLGLGGEGRAAPAELDAAGGMAKLLGGLLGKKSAPDTAPRGFLGIEIEDAGGGVVVRSVLTAGPAARAGLLPGDRITQCNGARMTRSSDLIKAIEALPPGRTITLSLLRGEKNQEIAVTTGEGL
jgi:hypothetical protein